jgi:N-acetylglucosamine repressor
MNHRGINSATMRQANEGTVLERIRRAGVCSKAELSRILGLTPASAGMIVSSLLQKGLLEPVGTGESRGGRRPGLYRLHAQGLHSCGIDVDRGGYDVLLLDLAGRVAGMRHGILPDGESFPEFATRAAKTLAGLLRETGVPPGRLAGVGLSVPGYVDAHHRRIVRAPNLGWHDEDAEAPLHRALVLELFADEDPFDGPGPFSLHLENEALAAAIGEHWSGGCQTDDDFLCIDVRSGIGAGVFVHGRPYRGAAGIAGEIGHVTVNASGPLCGCGRTGCLETLAATPRLLEALGLVYRPETAARDLLAFAESPDAEKRAKSIPLLSETARRLGAATAPLVNALNPSRIVFGRDLAVYGAHLLPGILDELRRDALAESFAATKVSLSELGGRASALGAAAIPLAGVFGREAETWA